MATKPDQQARPIILLFFAFFFLSLSAHAQDRIYRCDDEYTNTVTEEQAKNNSCKLISGGNITVVRVIDKNVVSTGSGFRVTSDGVIVTNNHVIHGCRRVRVNGDIATNVGADTYNDLALIKTTSSGQWVAVRKKQAAVGETVSVVGYPLNGLLDGFNMTMGSISGLSGIRGDSRYLQVTAPVQPGNSGGPLLDASGNVVGVVVAKLDALKMSKITGDIPQNVNFAISGRVLRSFLDSSKVSYSMSDKAQAVQPTDIAENARGFTVLIECMK